MRPSQLVVDGRVVELAPETALSARAAIEGAPDGTILVALRHDDDVIMRWLQADAARGLLVSTSRGGKGSEAEAPDKDEHAWLWQALAKEFDSLAREHAADLRTAWEDRCEDLLLRGKKQETYRRWISRIRKRWIKSAAEKGVNSLDMELLA